MKNAKSDHVAAIGQFHNRKLVAGLLEVLVQKHMVPMIQPGKNKLISKMIKLLAPNGDFPRQELLLEFS